MVNDLILLEVSATCVTWLCFGSAFSNIFIYCADMCLGELFCPIAGFSAVVSVFFKTVLH